MPLNGRKKSPFQKSPSRKAKPSVSRRSRSRTRKTNQYLLVGRESSVSQTRLAANGHSNGAVPKVALNVRLSRSRKRSRVSLRTDKSATTVQLDMVSVGLFAIAFIIRIWNIANPNSIAFDEQISGAQITSYFRREMYFSLDPPLPSQLYAAAAYLYGEYSLDFEFKQVGTEYSTNVPYVMWRTISVTSGALLVCTVYHLMRATGVGVTSALISSFILAIDPALTVQSRIFVGDNLVITLSMLSLLCAVHYTREESFRNSALGWLLAAGTLSGLSLSMKYTATFTILLVFYVIMSKLWTNIADGQYSARCLWKKLLFILIALVLLPSTIYMSSWSVHVIWLNKDNTADGHRGLASLQMSEAAFIHHAVTNGSSVTLRHVHGRSCWLHSHDLLYPKRYEDGRGSSHQQQVTCYPFADVNNRWTVVKSNFDEDELSKDGTIRHGDVISLVHESTGRLLNSHNVAAPLSPNKQEVSCFVDHNISMPLQPLWILEVDNRGEDTDEWLARRSDIKLIHVNTSAAISVTSKQLPDWGSGQYEVIADPFTFHENALWRADDLVSQRPSTVYNYSSYTTDNVTLSSTLAKIYKIHEKIFMTFYEYKDDHQYNTSPLDWPLGQTILPYWLSADDDTQIYMLPNIASWTSSLLCLLGLCLWYTLLPIVSRSPTITLLSDQYTGLSQQLLISLGGYLLNLIPYFLTDAPLLLYNYLPALVYCHISLGYVYHQGLLLISRRCSRFLVRAFFLIVVLVSVTFTYYLLPIVWGTECRPSLIKHLESFTNWKFLHSPED